MAASGIARRGISGARALALMLVAGILATDAYGQSKDKGARPAPPATDGANPDRPSQKARPQEGEKGRARPVDPEGCPLDGDRKLEMIV